MIQTDLEINPALDQAFARAMERADDVEAGLRAALDRARDRERAAAVEVAAEGGSGDDSSGSGHDAIETISSPDSSTPPVVRFSIHPFVLEEDLNDAVAMQQAADEVRKKFLVLVGEAKRLRRGQKRGGR